MFPIIKIAKSLEVPAYGVIFAIGYVIAVILAYFDAKRIKANEKDIIYSSVYIMLGLLTGAKIMYFISKLPRVVLHFDAFIRLFKLDIVSALSLLLGGMTFYGGLFGGICGFLIYCKKYAVGMAKTAYIIIPYIPFVHGFGRVGCFMAGCCYGIEYHGILAVHFPENIFISELNAVPRFPVQLCEAMLNFMIFGVLLLLRKKDAVEAKTLLAAYLIMYSTVRFFLEMVRGDYDRGVYGYISTSQIISVLILLTTVSVIMANRKQLE